MATKSDKAVKKTVENEVAGTMFDLEVMDGDWFPFFTSHVDDDGKTICDEPLPDAGKVCLRSMAPFIEDMQGERKTISEYVLNENSRAMERHSHAKEMTGKERREYQNKLWDYVIVDFTGFFDMNRKPMECTTENKLKLMKIPMFDRFIAKCLKSIGENAIKQTQELNENL